MNAERDATDSAVGFYKAAWLVVARGGWWTVQEIFAQIPLDIDVNKAHSLLWHMAKRHGMLTTRGFGSSREYAVTSECTSPKGLRVGEISEALGLALRKGTP